MLAYCLKRYIFVSKCFQMAANASKSFQIAPGSSTWLQMGFICFQMLANGFQMPCMPPYRLLYGETANGSLNYKRVPNGMPPYRPLYGETANGSLNFNRAPNRSQTQARGCQTHPLALPLPCQGTPEGGRVFRSPKVHFVSLRCVLKSTLCGQLPVSSFWACWASAVHASVWSCIR